MMKKNQILKDTPLKVLILEDSLLDLELMTEYLSEAGYELDVTHTEVEKGFRSALQNEKFDIILSDYKLPGFDAFGALEISQKLCPETPFICVSGSIGEELAIELLKKGAVDFVLKDRPKRLPFAIKNALEDAKEKAALLKAERNLRKSEEKFRNLFYNHAAVKLIIDPENGNIVEANEAAVGFYGWPEETLLNMNISQINTLPLEDVKKEMGAAKTKKKVNFEFQHRKADGSLVDVEVFSSKIGIDGKEFLHSIIHDVSEKKKAEKALIEHEKILAAMISASPIAIYRIDPDGTVQSWNKASERIFGWTEDEVLGKRLPLVPENKQNEFDRLRDRVLKRKAFTGLELERFKKDGAKIQISLSTAPITDENDNVVSILAMASDITERKKKDAKILLHSTALNSVANAVIITDREGNIEWVNDAWSELTGYQEEEVLGGNPRILKSGLQDESYYEELWDTILSGKVWTGELINRKKDGSLYHELQTITPLVDTDGEVTHLIGIKQDITEQKETEQELRELVREKNILLSEVHHRVKNNMAILSAMMYLERVHTTNEEVIESLRKNIHRIETIAAIHELVYASEKWSKVNLKKIAVKLMESVGRGEVRDCNVRIKMNSKPAFINVNQALPASLIMNEIFRGMYKAACRDERKSILKIAISESHGKINILLCKIGENSQSELSNIIGSLEMQLIDTLTKQLNGSIEYSLRADKKEALLIFDRDDSVSGTMSTFQV